jgi:hypothetical protein
MYIMEWIDSCVDNERCFNKIILDEDISSILLLLYANMFTNENKELEAKAYRL